MNIFKILVIIMIYSCNKQNPIKISDKYCLNNSTIAIKIAEKEWLKVYGKDIYQYRPFKARIDNDSIWVVYGTLHSNRVGGTPQAKINAKTCEIIQIIHGK